MNHRVFFHLCLAGVGLTVLAVACDSSTEVPFAPAGGAGGEAGATGGAGGEGASFSAGVGGMTGCTSDDDCDGGVCNEGVCCGSADLVCGAGCCADATEVCLFDACVVPGDDCFTVADCPPDHYCETALGDDPGTGGAGANCTQPLTPGKCLPLPPDCEDEPNNPDCLPACEFEPTAGQLSAVTKWQWGYDPAPSEFANKADVWSTPAVGRVVDANCDGQVDLADPPNIVFVSGDSLGTHCNNAAANGACKKGVLRMLDGSTGQELWSLDVAEVGSSGFAATSVAIGDVDADGSMDVVALTGEGKVAVIDATGAVTHLSTELVDFAGAGGFGWGGAVSLGDMNNDGWPEISYGPSVFTMEGGALASLFFGTLGRGASNNDRIMSHFADVNNDGDLELVAGNTAYQYDGDPLWQSTAPDGFTAIANFGGATDPDPEIVIVSGGNLYVIDALTGALELGPHDIPGSGQGGPPTVADFNGDGEPEVGVAMQNFYSMMKPNYAGDTIDDLWSTPNHDNSSSVTGSSVFDFEGDGKAEVVYMDECFLWVYDGTTGDVLYTQNSQSFTATETSIVADVDGDGHAEIVLVSNAANPNTWSCAHHTTGTDGYPIWTPPAAGAYRGITVIGDSANSWVGTRTLWNQHAYSVSNVCDPRDTACTGTPTYGEIPQAQVKNWTLPWLNNFRQNVQDGAIFDAPDPIVSIAVACIDPVPVTVSVRNNGRSGLVAGVEVGIFKLPSVQVGTVTTSKPLLPGQTEIIEVILDPTDATTGDTFYAEILVDPVAPIFNECDDMNNKSANVAPDCVQ